MCFFILLPSFFPQLPRYIDKLTSEMKDTGNLEGILLTGLTKDGVELMETYVDRTGDVQTASFCMLKVPRALREGAINTQVLYYGLKACPAATKKL